MSVTLNTQAMKYRETTADDWAPVTIQTEAEVNAVVQDTEPTGNENVWFDTSDESEVVVPTMDDFNQLNDNLNDSVVSLGNTKLNGTNGLYNNGIEIRNVNKAATVIFNSMYKNADSPSIWMDIDTANNTLTFYKDVGNGWVSMGNVIIA